MSLVPARGAAQWYVQRDVPATPIARYALYMEAGYQYQLETFGEEADPVLHLLDATNMEMAQDDDSGEGLNSYLTYTPSSSGYFVVVVRAYGHFSRGFGGVRWSRRFLPDGPWQAWNNFSSHTHFGGSIWQLAQNKKEYRTVMRSLASGGTPDTVLYTMDISGGITKFDDDSGVGRMDKITLGFTSYPTYAVLVGAYDTDGTTDVMANDAADLDRDGDGVGAGLETFLGTCDGAEDPAPHCRVCVIGPCPPEPLVQLKNFKDSDHDGLSDADEIFGVDNPADKNKALHLPAWGADPRRKDVFIEQDFGTGYAEGTPNPFHWSHALDFRAKYCGTIDPPDGPCTLPLEDEIKNLAGGGDGIHLHFDIGPSGATECTANPMLCGDWGGGGERTDSEDVGPLRTGIFRHLLIDPGDGGNAHVASDKIRAGIASSTKAAIHETGHALGLTHAGHWKWDSSTAPPPGGRNANCKPHYNSLMNYSFDPPWDHYNFSRGANTSVLDPGNINESIQAMADPAEVSRLTFDHLPVDMRTRHLFPRVDTTFGYVDWNRDNAPLPETLDVRGSLVTAGMGCSAHRLSSVEILPYTEPGVAAPDLAAFSSASRVYGFYANTTQLAVLYRSTPHSGNSTAGGCNTGTGRLGEACHTLGSTMLLPALSVPASPPGVVITAISALEWNGQLVVATHRSDRTIVVNRATGFDPSSGLLTGFDPTDRVVATDADSADLELAPMYVSTATTPDGHNYPASHPAGPNPQHSELLAVFYTTGTGSTAVHKFAYAAPGDVLAPWTARNPKNTGGSPLVGDAAPGVAVWPARSTAPGSTNYRELGYACGLFPQSMSGGYRAAYLYCYDKGSDAWSPVSTTEGFGAVAGKPAFAFHTLRRWDGQPIDDRRGQFWLGDTAALTGEMTIAISEEVSAALPPGGSVSARMIGFSAARMIGFSA